MSFNGYIQYYWGQLILIFGMGFVLYADTHLERRTVRGIFFVNTALLAYSLTEYAERYLASLQEYTVIRPFLTATNYSLVSLILVRLIMVLFPEDNPILLIPAAINTILCYLSLPTGLVFRISEDNNSFERGPLGYLTFFVSCFYICYLFIELLRRNGRQKEDRMLICFMGFTAAACVAIPMLLQNRMEHWFSTTIALDTALYYIYLLQQFTKRDSLTGLLNRQTYYADINKYGNAITALIAADMNGLKIVNDKEGHDAGDAALKTLAKCLKDAAGHGQRVYRIGGDEYIILCVGGTEDDAKALVSRIKENVSGTRYSCAVGYSAAAEKKNTDEMYSEADAMLYEDKKRYYEDDDNNRRKPKRTLKNRDI